MTSTLQHRGWILGIRQRATSVALALASVLVPAVVATRSAQAQTFTVLYTFKGAPDGNSPRAALIQDKVGNLYGTTEYGGASNGGTAFQLETGGPGTVLRSVTGSPDGGGAAAGVKRRTAWSLDLK